MLLTTTGVDTDIRDEKKVAKFIARNNNYGIIIRRSACSRGGLSVQCAQVR